MYEYDATVIEVIDGDTYRLRVDLGFGVNITKKFRLANADTPETRHVRGADDAEVARGKEVEAFITDLLLNKRVVIQSEKLVDINDNKADFYVRYLATVSLDGVDIGQLLTEKGMVRNPV